MFEKIKEKFKRTEGNIRKNTNDALVWFPIWEDSNLIKNIRYSIYKFNPRSVRTETKIKFPLVEYTNEIEEGILADIPLSSVGDLMDKWNPITFEDIKNLQTTSGFKPKIIKTQNFIFIIKDAENNWDVEIQQIEKRDLPEALELRDALNEIKKDDAKDKFPYLQKLHATIFNLKEKNPQLKMEIEYELGKKRKPTKVTFLGKEYCLLISHFGNIKFENEKAGGGLMLPILIPESAFDDLPFGEVFMGKILGILYFSSKPIFMNLGPGFVLIATAISVGMKNNR